MKVDSHKVAELDVLSLHNHLNAKVGVCSLEVSQWILDAATNKLELEKQITELQAAAKPKK